MDSEVSVMLHCAPAQGFEEHQVQVEISSRFNRRSGPEIEKHIEAVWSERVTKEPWLFNGAKFRLHSAELSTTPPQTSMNFCTKAQTLNSKPAEVDKQLGNHSALNHISLHCAEGERACLTETHTSSVNAKSEKSSCCRETGGQPQKDARASEANGVILRLQLGLTCYKDFLGTNWSQEAVNLQQRGRLEVGDPQALLAQPLGVGAVLLTSDGQVVMLRRSQRVAEAAGLLDIPGGHPEPKAVCEGVSEEDISVDLMQGCERAVVAEIFSSVCAEVRDEVNVPLGFLSAPVLMGIALNHTSAGRPSAEFFIRCSLTMEDVKDFYWRGGPEAHESTDIVFLSKSEMLQLDVKSPLWSELCPSAKGAVLLYQLVRPD
ncbi:uridine diphosphate glucose pyrophosphatase NUDT22 [Pangasianodon hypophthalmus]|uniref:uridine diphosphate glucose pyrophosphatase NUDT22 n=1 Tax=Pangasianodon hypophthalmus TaxID=310915 RepID=UPI0023083329|nr:uridine diphosphate glucose pyrophosphatase NUDT22 [Pangasianodon hypophthalmus]XP_053093076.1 uridine diphosphate glucose pyrophosphatase NUDT22 [Pangasianodon hypophthalmus]XP_053093077.1 uridine diphosphate glucose pyrophosphatase NUDT22 [Pangasianodon hypophthalmus]